MIRSRGLPTFGRTIPVAPEGMTCAATPMEASVISADLRSAARDARDLARQAAGLAAFRIAPRGDHRWSTFTPSLEPLSIVMLEYQTLGERRSRGHRLAAREAVLLLQPHEALELAGVALGGLLPASAGAQPRPRA